MKKTYVKENNGGGLSIELHEEGLCTKLVTGLEFCRPLTLVDLKTFGDSWGVRDVSGCNITGYDEEGNTGGYILPGKEMELTADEAVDDHETTKIIAEYDHNTKKLVINARDAGQAGTDIISGWVEDAGTLEISSGVYLSTSDGVADSVADYADNAFWITTDNGFCDGFSSVNEALNSIR